MTATSLGVAHLLKSVLLRNLTIVHPSAMSSSDRKRRILDHLAKSSSGSQFLIPKAAAKLTAELPRVEPVPAPEPVAPAPAVISSPALVDKPSQEERKRRIINHLSQSSGDFGSFSLSEPTQKKQILEHIRKSIG